MARSSSGDSSEHTGSINYEFTLAVDRDPTGLADMLFDIAVGDLVPKGGTGGNVAPARALQWTAPAANHPRGRYQHRLR